MEGTVVISALKKNDNGWMGGWMDGLVDGLMDELVNGWVCWWITTSGDPTKQNC